MTDVAYKQRQHARMLKRDPTETKLVLSGENRTDKQKLGNKKAIKTRLNRDKTPAEIAQYDEFHKRGCEAAAEAMHGCKKLYNPITKFAKPNSDKWLALINDNYIVITKE